MQLKHLILLYLAVGGLTDCQPANKQPRAKHALVVATTGMIADAIVQVADTSIIKVHTLIGAGGDPHLYVPLPRDVALLQQADLIFYNGLFLEGKMDHILTALRKEGKAYPVSSFVPESLLLCYEYGCDPHIWMSMRVWKHAVMGIARVLVERFPALAPVSGERAGAYLQMLDSLHRLALEATHSLPSQWRLLVTSHDAFGYLGRDYGLEVASLQGISTASDFGFADVRKVANLIAERRLPAIFVENTVSPRGIKAVIQLCKRYGWQPRLGGMLYGDALGAPPHSASTVAGMFVHNINTIVSGLQSTSQ